MKKILITIIAVVGVQNFVHLHAQTAIYVQPKNGEQIAFPLSEKPKITFNGQTMNVHSGISTPQSFALSDVQNLSFKKTDETRVADVMAQEQLQVYPNPVNDELRITNYELRMGDVVEMFDMNGKRVYVAPVGALHATPLPAGNQITINVSHLPAGMYVVKIGNRSAKIVKQ